MESGFDTINNLHLTWEQRKAVDFLAEFSNQMVLHSFTKDRTPSGGVNLIKEVYQVSDQVLNGIHKQGIKPVCKEGCHWCCYLRAKVTPLEILGILDFWRMTLNPTEMSSVRQRLSAADEITRGMDGNQRVCARIVCPLIVDGKCLAYTVRPIACRVYHSLNLTDCEMLLENQDRSMSIRPDISGLGLGIQAGLIEGLRAVGLQTRLIDLITGLHIIMNEPGTVDDWLAGKPAFAAAEIENATEIENNYRRLIEKLRSLGTSAEDRRGSFHHGCPRKGR
jgi:hypothetical protein